MAFRFLHAADLHLGAPFKGVRQTGSEAVNTALERATYDAFDRLIETALEREVDLALFAGDIYNQEDQNLRARLAFQRGMERLNDAGIPAYIIHGNHDPLRNAPLRLPENCHTFPTAPGGPLIARREGRPLASIYGVSYERPAVRENLAAAYPAPSPEEEGLFRIALLHANVGGQEGHDNYAPCTLDDLRPRGFDYWALGHVHTRACLHEGDPWVVYSGSLQGLSPRETGDHGCFLIEVNDAGEAASPEFVSLQAVRWFLRELDIAPFRDLDALLDGAEALLEAALQEAGGDCLVRLSLVGRGELHPQLREAQRLDLEEELRARFADRSPFCWLESLAVHSRRELSLDALRDGKGCVSSLLHRAEAIQQDEAALAKLRGALTDLYAEPEVRATRRRLPALSDEALREVLTEATYKALDLLDPEASE